MSYAEALRVVWWELVQMDALLVLLVWWFAYVTVMMVEWVAWIWDYRSPE